MNTTKRKFALTAVYLMAAATIATAQPGTLEMTGTGSTITTNGPNATPVTVRLREDIANLTNNTFFRTYNPALNLTASFNNQQYTATYGNISTGMAFGAGNTASTGGTTQQAEPLPIYTNFGSGLTGAPLNGMFVSSPTGTPVAKYELGGRGVGLDVEGTRGGKSSETLASEINFGLAVFTNVEPLFDANLAKDGRYYYGDLVLTFDRPVINPVVHIGGLGGSYSYIPSTGSSSAQISYFTTELELQNSNVTSTFMSGNQYFNVSGNNILNSATKPNAGSYDDGFAINGFPAYTASTGVGAATGSVLITGTVTQLVYKVYVRGSAASDFNFSKPQSAIAGATRRPLNGDLFYIAVSLNKPTQQITGNVYIDGDGLNDAGGGDINRTAGVKNPGTNVGGTVYANLLAGGLVVASVPVNADGSYLFNNVTIGTYTVNISTTQGTVGSAVAATPPTGWINTGEFVGAGAGSDGAVNGTSAPITLVAGTIQTEVNFGIERLPESIDFTTVIVKPMLNSTITLNVSSVPSMPVLSGSDPEDKPVTGVLTGNTVKITVLPVNSTLKYNGSNIVIGTNNTITNFDPTKLQILFNFPTPTQQTQFSYAYVDAAGGVDPTPAIYKITWTAGGPLAVVLSDFTATSKECSAIVSWSATSELNADKYEVEVTTKNDFTKAGTVIAAGNVSTVQHYEFTYPMQSGIVYYFRLKIINLDGTFSYSNSIVKASCAGNGHITVAPNPVKDVFHISGMAAGKNTIAIYSNDGKLVRTETISSTFGDVNISNFLKGIYIVRIIAENGTAFSQKIIKD